jgi:hypothetical protein
MDRDLFARVLRAFRRIDLLRALRDDSRRQCRFGAWRPAGDYPRRSTTPQQQGAL